MTVTAVLATKTGTLMARAIAGACDAPASPRLRSRVAQPRSPRSVEAATVFVRGFFENPLTASRSN